MEREGALPPAVQGVEQEVQKEPSPCSQAVKVTLEAVNVTLQ